MTAALPALASSPGVKRAAEGLRRCATLIEAWADIDRASLYEDGRSSEAAWWSMVWKATVSTALDIPAADMCRALTVQLVQRGLRTPRAFESPPPAKPGEDKAAHAARVAAWRKGRGPLDKPVHHDTIANACAVVEEWRDDVVIAGFLDDLSDELKERMTFGAPYRAELDERREARAKIAAPMTRHRAAALALEARGRQSTAARIVAERAAKGGGGRPS